MNSSKFIILPILVGYILAHDVPFDPSCYELKTTKRADDCCKLPGRLDSAIVDSCMAKLDPTQNKHEQFHCVGECIAQKMGMMKNGTVDKEAGKLSFVKSVGKDPNFAPIIGGVFDKCYDRVTAIPEHRNAKYSVPPAILISCVDAELFKVCPPAVWVVSEGCNELKSKLVMGCPFSAIDNKQ